MQTTNTQEKLNTSSVQLGRYHAVYTHVEAVHLPHCPTQVWIFTFT